MSDEPLSPGSSAGATEERGETRSQAPLPASSIDATRTFSGPPPATEDGPPRLGDHVDDFELLEVLGSGAFATVYLARQISLDRRVALKVSANRGNEARTLASLEHDNIVGVFSEVIDSRRNLRLLCMQFVSGTTLERVIDVLRERDRGAWCGKLLLEAIDELATHPALFDPAALRDRERLMGFDFAQTVCWLGGRVAEALAYAHGRGVLHRDVKPANILMNRYGRPLLADFNVSSDAGRPCAEGFGGTLVYMAPEHLRAFAGGSAEAVDARSDLYSLGLVLFELLAGQRPFAERPTPGVTLPKSLRAMTAERECPAPQLRHIAEDVPEVVDRVIRRCLDPNPEGRYQTGSELALALAGCNEHRRAEIALPPPRPITRLATRHPLLVGGLLLFLPHLLGSAVNIAYNSIRIVERLNPAQQQAFMHLILGYNLLVYGTCLALFFRLVMPLVRGLRQLETGALPDAVQVKAWRQRMLRLPLWTGILSCLGWLPGGIVFPLGIGLLAQPVGPAIFEHFMVSFTISGLIALTYSVYGIEFLTLRVLYLRVWVDGVNYQRQAASELTGIENRLYGLQLLAGLIPLLGATMMVAVGPDQFSAAGYQTFRWLVTPLIGLGMMGFCAALSVSARLAQVLNALRGERKQHGSG